MQTPLKSSIRSTTSSEDFVSGQNFRQQSDSNEESNSEYTLKASWKIKTFVIDTNVLLHDPDALEVHNFIIDSKE